jgi:UPF0755 protein
MLMEEPLDPQKFHVLSDTKKRYLYIVLTVALVVLVPVFLKSYFSLAAHRPSQSGKEIEFEIKKGDSVVDVAQNLLDKNAINSKILFIVYMYSNGLDKTMQAGMFKIKAGSSVVDLGELFKHGTSDVRLTFLEGWRVEEIAREAALRLKEIDYKSFVEKAKPLEGFLFPDTYFFADNASTDDVVTKLNDTFEEKTKDLLSTANLVKSGLAKEQAVIFASLVEREASVSADRKIIAGILIKRWKENMKLDVDATAQYAVTYQSECRSLSGTCSPIKEDPSKIEWWPGNLTATDLILDNPYNTRAVVGLPPTPICSVSLSSLDAVINPTNTDYYYYLVDGNGVTHYATTLEGHNLNVSKYLPR